MVQRYHLSAFITNIHTSFCCRRVLYSADCALIWISDASCFSSSSAWSFLNLSYCNKEKQREERKSVTWKYAGN